MILTHPHSLPLRIWIELIFCRNRGFTFRCSAQLRRLPLLQPRKREGVVFEAFVSCLPIESAINEVKLCLCCISYC